MTQTKKKQKTNKKQFFNAKNKQKSEKKNKKRTKNVEFCGAFGHSSGIAGGAGVETRITWCGVVDVQEVLPVAL